MIGQCWCDYRVSDRSLIRPPLHIRPIKLIPSAAFAFYHGHKDGYAFRNYGSYEIVKLCVVPANACFALVARDRFDQRFSP